MKQNWNLNPNERQCDCADHFKLINDFAYKNLLVFECWTVWNMNENILFWVEERWYGKYDIVAHHCWAGIDICSSLLSRDWYLLIIVEQGLISAHHCWAGINMCSSLLGRDDICSSLLGRDRYLLIIVGHYNRNWICQKYFWRVLENIEAKTLKQSRAVDKSLTSSLKSSPKGKSQVSTGKGKS